MQVHSFGVLSFRSPSALTSPQAFPLRFRSDILVAPFWEFVDIRLGGSTFFRLSDDEVLLSQVGSMIMSTYDSEFSPSLLFIATWDRVERFTRRVNAG